MHLASSVGNSKIVEHLLNAGAQVNARDRWGGTPLRDAVREGHREVARVLRAAGGELGFDEVAASGELCELAKRGSLDLLELMVSCGVDVNAADCTLLPRQLRLTRVRGRTSAKGGAEI